MATYGVDWCHKDEKTAIYGDEGLLKKEPEYIHGDIVATENMPHHKCVELHHKGVKIYRCNTDLTKNIRERDGIEKTDENDAKIIYEQFKDWHVDGMIGNIQDERFRKFRYDLNLETLSYQVKVRAEAVEARKKSKQRTKIDPILASLLIDDVKESKNAVARLDRKIAKVLEQFPIYNDFLKDINGIGAASAGELLSIIKDINRFPTVGKLWAYFGLDVRDGKAPKKRKGTMANWSQRGRSLILNDIVSNGFKMNGVARFDKETGELKKEASEWRVMYDKFKENEVEKNEARPEEEQISKGHADNRAIRKTGKEFLKRLYNEWKEMETSNG